MNFKIQISEDLNWQFLADIAYTLNKDSQIFYKMELKVKIFSNNKL